ncbi:hypothetical protein [Turneriella parva]|uniref:Uncharacterized protein n=1 Tax=Turneriella parva (strain ATCC BAA-1111 / DSM 21527 / NCTC 11395 / H) TaxID=869212 RepID=I4B382_TURPD|nr:hypothetical protein [Turneriella parva]AFM11739.1 hypothetical protein Turpa_1090 [Turneriella parva DSM 21527]
MRIYLIWTLMFVVSLSYCSGGMFNSKTNYAENKKNDANHPFNESTFRSAIGEEKYQALFNGSADGDLKLLLYGIGQSNAIDLVNAVSDVNRISEILNAPEAISALTLVGLINAVDAHIRNGRKYAELAEPNDTLRKISVLLNYVDSMTTLKKIIKGMTEQPADPHGFSPTERLALLVAMTNEEKKTIAIFLNRMVTPDESLDAVNLAKVLRLLNETKDLSNLAKLLNGIAEGVPEAPIGLGLLNAIDLLRALDDLNITKLLRIINESNDVLRLAALMNTISPAGVENVIGLIQNLDDNGITHTILLLNDEKVSISRFSQVVNGLTQSAFARPNNDDFSSAAAGSLPMGVHSWVGWSTPGVAQQWNYNPASQYGAALQYDLNGLGDGKVAILRTRIRTTVAGNISFTLRKPEMLAANEGVLVYCDGATLGPYAANYTDTVSCSVNAGLHDLKILVRATSTPGTVYLQNFMAPGMQGAERSAVQKVAILLNQINITGVSSVAQILSGLNETGTSRFLALLERTQYPAALAEPCRLTTVVNSLSKVAVLVSALNGADANGVARLGEIINFTADNDLPKIVAFLNGLDTVAAPKVPEILNSLTANGSFSLLDVLNEMPVQNIPHLVELVGGVQYVNHYGNILSSLSPLSYTRHPDGGTFHYFTEVKSEWSGARKLASILNKIIARADTEFTVKRHMVRLSDDLVTSQGKGLIQVIDGLSFFAPTQDGLARIEDLMYRLRKMSPDPDRYYNHPFELSENGSDFGPAGNSADPNDHFGRLSTLANAIDQNGAASMAAMVNYTPYNADNFEKLVQLITAARRIQYVADMANKLHNYALLTSAIPLVNMTAMVEILNGIGDSTKRGNGIKLAGDMYIFADAMNRLRFKPDGSPRSPAKQQQIIRLINEVTYCGIKAAHEGEELPDSSKFILEKSASDCVQNGSDNVLKRATNVMLGLENAKALAVLVGDITDVNKIILLMNSVRDSSRITRLVNLVPEQVMLTHLENLSYGAATNEAWAGYGDAISRSLVPIVNTLEPEDIARMVHFGTGIGKGTAVSACILYYASGVYYPGGHRGFLDKWGRTPADCTKEKGDPDQLVWHVARQYKLDRKRTLDSPEGCNYYHGAGPKRMARLLNIENGANMLWRINKFGPRTVTAALSCGLAGAPGTQQGIEGTIFIGGAKKKTFLSSTEEQTIFRPNGTFYGLTYRASSDGACSTEYRGEINSYISNWVHPYENDPTKWELKNRGYFPNVTSIYSPWSSPSDPPQNRDNGAGFEYPEMHVDPNFWNTVTDQKLHGSLGAQWLWMGSYLLSPVNNYLPADCDVVPEHDTFTGTTNAVGDGGPPPS